MSPLVGATDPSPSCSVPRGVLYATASPAVSHWTGTPAARGLPEARLMKSGTSTSLVAAGPVRSITRVLQGGRQGVLYPHVMKPVLRAAAHQSCRLRSTDVLQKPRVSCTPCYGEKFGPSDSASYDVMRNRQP